VDRWIRQPHVARWWIPETTAETEVEKFASRLGTSHGATRMCTVELEGQPIGWCQWYRWDDYPEEAAASGAETGEVGADYAIGEPACVGRGVGTAMIAALVDHVRATNPGAGLVVAPEADNLASRRVLEKNGFELVDVRPVATEPHDRPMAIYRLGPPGGW
jgi:aminoglycoside 6'-N-acetyltransferase